MPVSSAKVWETTNCFAMCHWSTWGQPSGDFMFKDWHWLKRILEHGNIEHTHTHNCFKQRVYNQKQQNHGPNQRFQSMQDRLRQCPPRALLPTSLHSALSCIYTTLYNYYISILIYVHITRWTSSSNIECNIECLAESDSSGKKGSVGTPIARWTKTWPAALFTLIFQICRWQHLSTQPRRPECHHKAQDAGQTGNLHQAGDANNSQGPKAFPGKTNPTHRWWCAKMGKACRDTKNKKYRTKSNNIKQ